MLFLVKLESVFFFFLLNSHLCLDLSCFILLVTFLNRKNIKLSDAEIETYDASRVFNLLVKS